MFFFRNDDGRGEVCVGTASQAISRAERIVQSGLVPRVTRANGKEVTINGLIMEVVAEKRRRTARNSR